jgi:hypothetical protein
MPVTNGPKVARFHPSDTLVGVTSLGPSPQCLEDSMVHRLEGFRADHMPVVHRPAPDDRVQVADEGASRGALITLNDRSDVPQHRLDALR